MKHRYFLSLAVLALCASGCDQAPSQEPTKLAFTLGRVPASDGVPIAYKSQGSGDVALVFVHGWMCDQTYWRHQVAAFKDRFRIVTIDLPGHGDSAATRLSWTLEGYGDDVVTLVEHLALEKVVLVGHSMGGAVILEAAAKLGPKVVGVIGVETLHNAEFEVSDEVWQPLMESYRNNFVGTCESMVTAMFPAPTEELALEVKADMCGGPADVGIALMDRFGSYQGAELMAQIEAPIRAINAQHSTPTQVEINRKYAPQFDAVIQDGAGHFLMLEAPERFNALFEETLGAMGI